MSEKHPAITFRPYATAPHRAFVTTRDQADKDTALIVLDTNVLLAPYRSSSQTLEAIRKTYLKLRKERRILVPGQVAREFARNRSNLLADVHRYVTNARSASVNGKFEPPPILVGTDECKAAQKHLDAAQDELRKFRGQLDRLASIIATWERHDPVLEVYEKLFDASVVRELSIDATTLEEIRKVRFEAGIPPGYKDKGKEDGGIGDLAIWLTLLEAAGAAKCDTIFVTEETKVDWFHRSGEERLFPRHELVEEFRAATGGRSVAVWSLAELLEEFGASPQVVEEVKSAAAREELVGRRDSPTRYRHVLSEGLLGRIKQRVWVNGGTVEPPPSDVGPDILIGYGADRLGVSIVILPGLIERPSLVCGRQIERAKTVASRLSLTEHLVLFVARDRRTIRRLDNWLAEDSYQGAAVSVAVGLLEADEIKVVGNQAEHLFLRTIFERA